MIIIRSPRSTASLPPFNHHHYSSHFFQIIWILSKSFLHIIHKRQRQELHHFPTSNTFSLSFAHFFTRRNALKFITISQFLFSLRMYVLFGMNIYRYLINNKDGIDDVDGLEGSKKKMWLYFDSFSLHYFSINIFIGSKKAEKWKFMNS